MCFGLSVFCTIILHTSKPYKVKSNYKKKVSNRYKFHTGLSKLRASSPAKSRPPFAQICVINLLSMLQASLGISTKSVEDWLKVGLFTIFACVQPDFRNVAVVPREASRAQSHRALLLLHQAPQLCLQCVRRCLICFRSKG
jgi:hypothetical protein